MEIRLTVSKSSVMHEVQKATSYTGAKAQDETGAAYDLLRATDADRELLETYWSEAAAHAVKQLRRWVVSSSATAYPHHPDLSADFTVKLRVSAGWDTALKEPTATLLTSYFVAFITGKWFGVSSPDKAQPYATEAAAVLESVKNNLYHRRKPRRE